MHSLILSSYSVTLSSNSPLNLRRSISQIKSHAQNVARQIEAGEGIFQELTCAEAHGLAPQSPANLLAMVSDTTKRRAHIRMDPTTLSKTAPLPTSATAVIANVMAVQDTTSVTTAESLTSAGSPCAGLSTADNPSVHEIVAAEALCALKST
jgi:hypothetical protein